MINQPRSMSSPDPRDPHAVDYRFCPKCGGALRLEKLPKREHEPERLVCEECASVLFLNPNGTVKGHQKISSTDGGFTGSLDNWDTFGHSVANLGDLDGDGTTDIVVGALAVTLVCAEPKDGIKTIPAPQSS